MAKKIIVGSIDALKRDIKKLEKRHENLKIEEREAAGEIRKHRIDIADKLRGSREVLGILRGLKETQKMDDPGKYGKAYYFVAKLGKDDAEKSTIPRVHQKCRVTGKLVPLIMSYEQTYDSPEGDTWEKRVFYIRGDNMSIVEVARFTRDDRF